MRQSDGWSNLFAALDYRQNEGRRNAENELLQMRLEAMRDDQRKRQGAMSYLQGLEQGQTVPDVATNQSIARNQEALGQYGIQTDPSLANQVTTNVPFTEEQKLERMAKYYALNGDLDNAKKTQEFLAKEKERMAYHNVFFEAYNNSGMSDEGTKKALIEQFGPEAKEQIEGLQFTPAGVIQTKEGILTRWDGTVMNLPKASSGSPSEARWIATVNDPNASPEERDIAEKNLKMIQDRKVQLPIRVETGKNEAQASQVTDDVTDQWYQYYKTTGQMPQEMYRLFRMPGAQMAAIRKIAERAKKDGFGGDERAIKMAMFKAGESTARMLQFRRDNILAFEQNALQNAKQVYQLVDKLDPAQIPVLNQAILAGKTKIEGDPVASSYMLAWRTFVNEYARVATTVTGGGVTSDTARKEMESVLSSAKNAAMMQAGLRQAAMEMAHRKYGYDVMLEENYSRLSGGKAAPFKSKLPTEKDIYNVFRSHTPYVVPSESEVKAKEQSLKIPKGAKPVTNQVTGQKGYILNNVLYDADGNYLQTLRGKDGE